MNKEKRERERNYIKIDILKAIRLMILADKHVTFKSEEEKLERLIHIIKVTTMISSHIKEQTTKLHRLAIQISLMEQRLRIENNRLQHLTKRLNRFPRRIRFWHKRGILRTTSKRIILIEQRLSEKKDSCIKLEQAGFSIGIKIIDSQTRKSTMKIGRGLHLLW